VANLEKGNRLEHKAQLIEIDKLLANTQNGPKQGLSKLGVWHQVSLKFLFGRFFFRTPLLPEYRWKGEENFSFAFFGSHLMNVAVLLRSKHVTNFLVTRRVVSLILFFSPSLSPSR
jgi:hypothetical protein